MLCLMWLEPFFSANDSESWDNDWNDAESESIQILAAKGSSGKTDHRTNHFFHCHIF